jgi:L-aminopeptidase/D-esterase-like protein
MGRRLGATASFNLNGAIVPIVPQAILFDLLNGGDKDWGRRTPYQELAWRACEAAGLTFRSRHGWAGLRRARAAEGQAESPSAHG